MLNPERDPVAAAAKLLQDCSLSPPSLLESTVYKAFALLSHSAGELYNRHQAYPLVQQPCSWFKGPVSLIPSYRKLKGVDLRC